MKLLLFGRLAEVAGCTELDIGNAADSDSVYAAAIGLCPLLEGIPATVAVNMQIVKSNERVTENDEIALLPPFAGG
jgi:molybdopterin converting factor small subunit